MMKIKTPKKTESLSRNGVVDFLKFIFSLFIAALHFNGIVDYPDERFKRGYFAVEFFFMVSGFLFAKSMSKFDDKPTADIAFDCFSFIKKKYLSVFPYQIFTVIITVIGWIVIYQYGFRELIIRLSNVFPSIFFIQMLGAPSDSWFFHEWYISSMLIVMMILTPIMIKSRKVFTYCIAPIASLFSIYFIFNTKGTLDTTTDMYGFIYSGNIRALADISLGCISFEICSNGIPEKFSKALLIAVETICFASVFLYIYGDYDRNFEFTLIFVLMLAITILFTDKASISFMNNRLSYFLGKLSLPLYLFHVPLRYFIKNINLPYGYNLTLLIFLSLSITLSAICLIAAEQIKKYIHINKHYKY